MERAAGKQLFVDDFFIESLSGAHRVLNRPDKLTMEGPLPSAAPLEHERDTIQYTGVLYDERNQQFRLYYRAWHDHHFVICAMESDDGINWRRPDLGLVEIDRSTMNNATNCPADPLVMFWDPHEREPAFQWKRLDNAPTGSGPNGTRVWQACHSADGYDWRPYPAGTHSTQSQLFAFGAPYESFGGSVNPDARYVHYAQRGSGRRTRVLGRRDSENALDWSGLRTVIDQDLSDPLGTEFYGSGFDSANRTDGGLHILMLSVFHTDLTEPHEIAVPKQYWGPGKPGPSAIAARVDGVVETQLAASRDTMSWTRWREPFLERGKPGAWDWGAVYTQGPILHDQKLWFYYCGNNLTHGGRTHRADEAPYATPGRLGQGLAVMRPDGYVSVEADSYAPGWLTTHRFRQEAGGIIHANVDAQSGELSYELLEDTGQPISGYTLADCDPIRSDALDAPLSWKGRARWPAAGEDPRRQSRDLHASEYYIKLRFQITRGTQLYSVTLDPPEVTCWRAPLKGRVD